MSLAMPSKRKPALFTTTPRFSAPHRSTPAPTSASANPSSMTLPGTPSASPPLALISETIDAVDSSVRSFTTSRAPWFAKSFATDAPIPRPAPVTIAVRPSSMVAKAELTANHREGAKAKAELAASCRVITAANETCVKACKFAARAAFFSQFS